MTESVRKTKRLTEAAAAAAIASLLVLLKLIAPFLVVVTMVAAPSPIAAVTRDGGVRWGLGAAAAVIFLVTITGGPEIGLTTAVYAGALGLAMGYGFRRGWPRGRIIALTAAAYLVEMSYKIVFSMYVLGIADALSSVLSRMVSILQWVWQPLAGVLGYDPDPGRAVFSLSGAVMAGVIFVLDGWCYAYLNVELFQELLKRLRAAGR